MQQKNLVVHTKHKIITTQINLLASHNAFVHIYIDFSTKRSHVVIFGETCSRICTHTWEELQRHEVIGSTTEWRLRQLFQQRESTANQYFAVSFLCYCFWYSSLLFLYALSCFSVMSKTTQVGDNGRRAPFSNSARHPIQIMIQAYRLNWKEDCSFHITNLYYLGEGWVISVFLGFSTDQHKVVKHGECLCLCVEVSSSTI